MGDDPLNDMAKNLLLWMVIAAVLLTVFNNINQETSTVSITYSEFVKEVRAGQVRSVNISGISISGRRMDNSQFTTTIPMIGDDQLMNDLFNNGVEIVGSEPERQSIWSQLFVASFQIGRASCRERV